MRIILEQSIYARYIYSYGISLERRWPTPNSLNEGEEYEEGIKNRQMSVQNN